MTVAGGQHDDLAGLQVERPASFHLQHAVAPGDDVEGEVIPLGGPDTPRCDQAQLGEDAALQANRAQDIRQYVHGAAPGFPNKEFIL